MYGSCLGRGTAAEEAPGSTCSLIAGPLAAVVRDDVFIEIVLNLDMGSPANRPSKCDVEPIYLASSLTQTVEVAI